MKKSIVAIAAVIIACATMSAQESKSFFITLQGGPNATMNENTATYFTEKKAMDLIDWANGGITFGYFFNNVLGARLACEYGSNHGCYSANPFTEFTFNNVSAFADVIFSGVPMDSEEKFFWRPFVGVGLGHSMGFKNSGTDNQAFTPFGFRFGLNLEFMVTKSFGIVAEGINEWYTDSFNGIVAGRPLDGRLTANVGVAYHF